MANFPISEVCKAGMKGALGSAHMIFSLLLQRLCPSPGLSEMYGEEVHAYPALSVVRAL